MERWPYEPSGFFRDHPKLSGEACQNSNEQYPSALWLPLTSPTGPLLHRLTRSSQLEIQPFVNHSAAKANRAAGNASLGTPGVPLPLEREAPAPGGEYCDLCSTDFLFRRLRVLASQHTNLKALNNVKPSCPHGPMQRAHRTITITVPAKLLQVEFWNQTRLR